MNIKYSNIILTGSTGWLGSRLATALSKGLPDLRHIEKGGKQLVCFVKPGENIETLLNLGVKIRYGDITNPEAVHNLLHGQINSLVIHAAGLIHPTIFTKKLYEVNFKGTRNILEAANQNKVKRLVVISSNSPLGCNSNSDEKFTENSPYNPYMEYGKSKYQMEKMLLRTIKDTLAPEVTIIRPPWFYGPNQPGRQTEFFRMIKNGKFPLMGKGSNRRSMGYIDNLVLGTLLAAYNPKAAGEIYWIADEKPYSMLEIVDTIKDVLKYDFGLVTNKNNLHVPSVISDLARLTDRGLQSFGIYSQKIHVLSEMNQTIACDISKAKKDLGYKPICGLREGMQKSVEWCLNNGQTI